MKYGYANIKNTNKQTLDIVYHTSICSALILYEIRSGSRPYNYCLILPCFCSSDEHKCYFERSTINMTWHENICAFLWVTVTHTVTAVACGFCSQGMTRSQLEANIKKCDFSTLKHMAPLSQLCRCLGSWWTSGSGSYSKAGVSACQSSWGVFSSGFVPQEVWVGTL